MADTSKKIDMSLDDIIKLNRKQKSSTKQKGNQFQTNSNRGQRGGKRRGTKDGSVRGSSGWRGKAGVSPLNRSKNSSLKNQKQNQNVQKFQQNQNVQKFQQNQNVQKFQRGRGRGQTRGRGRLTLQQQRENALIALQDAKKKLAALNTQKRSRDNKVNQQRGMQSLSSRGRGRGTGRGRGRGSSFKINRNFSTQLTQSQSTQPFINKNLTVGNREEGRSQRGRQQKRQWRSRPTTVTAPVTGGAPDDSILTISINNQPSFSTRKLPPPQNDNDMTQEIINMRPSEPKKYKFQKNFFSSAATSISLSDRFADGEQEDEDGSRRVFF